jgi:hypothetical protein
VVALFAWGSSSRLEGDATGVGTGMLWALPFAFGAFLGGWVWVLKRAHHLDVVERAGIPGDRRD